MVDVIDEASESVREARVASINAVSKFISVQIKPTLYSV